MPFRVGRRIALTLAVSVLVLGASAMLVLPARADAGSAVVGPADGAVVGGDTVTFTATGADIAYEFRWGTEDAVDADGRLSDVGEGGQGTVRAASYSLSGLAADTYFWQVRLLEDGARWSPPRAFTIDPDAEGLQLETYPLDGAPTLPGPLAGVDGIVWVVFASVFAVGFLAVVFVKASQSRRPA